MIPFMNGSQRNKIMDLSLLNDAQRSAVLHTEGPLLVLAGAGSGKTRVLTHRIAYLIESRGVPPWNILALTFTNKAAREMRERVNLLIGEGADSIWLATFHGFCARLLSMEIDKIGYDRAFIIYDDYDQQVLISHISSDLGIDEKQYPKRLLSSIFSEAKNSSLTPEDYLSAQALPVRQVFREYQKRLKEYNALDFDDLLLKTIELFETCPDVLEKYRERFRYILVDEYQDTNLCQYHIVRLLAEKHRNICVVGDDDQSIYAWRGADIRNILEFERDFLGADTIRLEQNYRSTEQILNAANRVISNNRGRKPKSLWTKRKDGEQIDIFCASDERDEAAFVCNRILRGVREGSKYDDFAILYRTHAQSRIIEMMLKSYDIPYRVYGGISFFDRAEIKDILCYLRLFSNPADNEAFLRVINVPKRKIGQASVAELVRNAANRNIPLMSAALIPEGLPKSVADKLQSFTVPMTELYEKYSVLSLLDFTSELLEKIDYDAYLHNDKADTYETRREAVMELLGYIREFEQSYEEQDGEVLQSFLNNIALFSNADQVDEQNGCVNLMTLHAAKGLEFSTVFLCGLEDRLFPSTQAIGDPTRLEEERRLCYVGITRAKDKLYLSYAQQRTLYGQISAAIPSRFLEEIDPKVGQVERIAPSYERRSTPAFVRSEPPVIPKKDLKGVECKVGDRIAHKAYGEGRVVSTAGSGANQIVEIRFAGGTVKKFAAAYAPLSLLEE
ncbi:MAG: UvrD-helicase domain-containing protein [Clostridia bacterium]|nr:UvrD-helicase domain-containing protein [Clostridia bacterium]